MGQTVLLTGASGFIAKHIARGLLDAGHQVRGTVRSSSRGDQVREAVRPHLADDTDLDTRLTFAVADLEADQGWAEAMVGVDAVVHTASPFPLAQPKDESSLVRPAVDGTLRVLRAANDAGVKRVVLTSSTVAVINGDLPDGREVYDEGDWSDVDHPASNAYSRSKTLAERAAWAFVADEAPELALTVINPAFVVGPPLDDEIGSSLSLVVRLLKGKDPMLPNYGIPVVDVRDVAEMHVRALDRPETAGRRYISASGSMWLTDMGEVLKEAYPKRRIPTRSAPGFAVRLLALFDSELRTVLPDLGTLKRVSTARAESDMDMSFIPAADSLLAAAEYLLEHDLV